VKIQNLEMGDSPEEVAMKSEMWREGEIIKGKMMGERK